MVYWSLLMEGSLGEDAADAMLDVATFAGYQRYVRIGMFRTQVDVVRNAVVQMFLEAADERLKTKDPADYLVMLDADHTHPHDILYKLTRHGLPIVGALSFRRAKPFDPLIFRKNGEGKLKRVDVWTGELMEVDAVGSGAIAIQRGVFEMLAEKGHEPPYFRFDYRLGDPVWRLGEELYFCELCRQCGIRVHCDSSVITPHLTVCPVQGREWKAYLASRGNSVEELTQAGVRFTPPAIKTQVRI